MVCAHSTTDDNEFQVVGDLWERYVQLIEADVPEGYVAWQGAIDTFPDAEQRRYGPTRSHEVLLSPYDHDPRRSDREAFEVGTYKVAKKTSLIWCRYNPAERDIVRGQR